MPDVVRRIVYEIGRGRAIDNTRREVDATRIALARVEALARRLPPATGESSPEMRRSAVISIERARTLAQCSTG